VALDRHSDYYIILLLYTGCRRWLLN